MKAHYFVNTKDVWHDCRSLFNVNAIICNMLEQKHLAINHEAIASTNNCKRVDMLPKLLLLSFVETNNSPFSVEICKYIA